MDELAMFTTMGACSTAVGLASESSSIGAAVFFGLWFLALVVKHAK